jgi:hypothetical protein
MRQAFNRLLSYWSKFVDLLFPNRKQNQQKERLLGEITEDAQSPPITNLHYSIPGKAFTGSIDKGHVVKTENNWPLTGS